MNMILMQSGYPPIDLKFTYRRRYYDAFDSYDRSGDTGPMTRLIGEYVKTCRESDEALTKIRTGKGKGYADAKELYADLSI